MHVASLLGTLYLRRRPYNFFLLLFFSMWVWSSSCRLTRLLRGTRPAIEDLSIYRPPLSATYLAPPTTIKRRSTAVAPLVDDTATVQAILQQRAAEAIEQGTVTVYTLEIYSGTQRTKALAIKKQLYKWFAHLPNRIDHEGCYRVRLGYFVDYLTAWECWQKVKQRFTHARLCQLVLSRKTFEAYQAKQRAADQWQATPV